VNRLEDADFKDDSGPSPGWAAWHDSDSEASLLVSSCTVTAAEGHSIPKVEELLPVLKSTKHNFWKTNITLDASFFYVHTDFEQRWLLRDEEPETREPHMISSEK
jgi:hypothetical protein